MNTKVTTATLLAGLVLCTAAAAFGQVQPIAVAPPTSTTTTAAATIGQTITLSGTAYNVSATKVLATGVEFYTMKATTPKATAQNFLRTMGTYNPTVFTKAQYEAFFNTGKLSSFGTLKKETVGIGAYTYVMKGTRTVLLTVSGDGHALVIDELPDGMTMARLRDTGSHAWKGCRDGCTEDYNDCYAIRGSVAGDCTPGASQCACEMLGCARRCDDSIPAGQRPVTHVTRTTVSVLQK